MFNRLGHLQLFKNKLIVLANGLIMKIMLLQLGSKVITKEKSNQIPTDLIKW